jgi:DNA-binding NarL/FixJ family response regulator
MHILLVEDDHMQSDFIRQSLLRTFSDVRIEVIDTEHRLRSSIDQIAANPPDVVIMDVILRWTDPAPEMPLPPVDVKVEGHYRAGFRCQKLLAEHPGTKRIPVIFYTILEAGDMKTRIDEWSSSNVHYLAKNSDLSQLIELIRQSVRR